MLNTTQLRLTRTAKLILLPSPELPVAETRSWLSGSEVLKALRSPTDDSATTDGEIGIIALFPRTETKTLHTRSVKLRPYAGQATHRSARIAR